jgi:signal transduction histidine kinase
MDEIYGEENFVGDIVRKTKSMTADKETGFNFQHEYLLIYAKLDELISYTLKVDDIEFSVDIKDDIEINIHLNDILQVLINIVKNARDALVELPIKHKKIIVKVYKKNKNIIITIKDNAGGISNEIIDRIFDAYFTTKANKNGTGLGLYMSKNIIENHGQGLLSVKNEDGGAIFKITLPIK